ncbi:cell wall hydrolase [Dehalobacter sp. DCM]|uniref:cell wall hydrolase n=1 Tax=Dehalobacter sp. DCM TaxID=2907827 RepID=UPI00308138C8|nr:cell wall hydrolase [Dehalobacter sp. DCM]
MVDRRCRRGLAIVLTTVLFLSASTQHAYALTEKPSESVFSKVWEINETIIEKARETDFLRIFDRLTSRIEDMISNDDDSISFSVITMPQLNNTEADSADSQIALNAEPLNNEACDQERQSEPSRGQGIVCDEEDIRLLAKIIYAEARGESFEGQVAVGAVVLNRVESSHFPDTIKDVIYQPGQFSAVNDKQIELTPDDQAYEAALAALEGQDPTNGAVFYYNPMTATDNWIKTRDVVKHIGNHTFCV